MNAYDASARWTATQGGPRPLTPEEVALWNTQRGAAPQRVTRREHRAATAITRRQHNALGLPSVAKGVRVVRRRARVARHRFAVALAIASTAAVSVAYTLPSVPRLAGVTVALALALAYLAGRR